MLAANKYITYNFKYIVLILLHYIYGLHQGNIQHITKRSITRRQIGYLRVKHIFDNNTIQRNTKLKICKT